jgi:Zn-dependent alcohol dehydrogenase
MGLGGFAERALIHENQLALVPKDMPFAQAALLGCGVVTGAGAVLNTADVRAGDTVVKGSPCWARAVAFISSASPSPRSAST